MIALEAITALLVGLAVLVLILGPLVGSRSAEPPAAALDEPEEFEETRKGMALGALKEIEFDRATGKLSEEDYEALKAKYTIRAVEILREEQTDPVEALIAARVKSLRDGQVPSCPTCGPRPESDAAFCSSCGSRLEGAMVCPICGGGLVPGGRFCGSCGSAVAA
jgi:hypothetical protein